MFLPILDLNFNTQGRAFKRVSASSGSDNPRRGRNRPYLTIQAAVDDADARTVILIEPGAYDETVTIPRTQGPLVIVGMGGRGAAFIATSATNGVALTNHADDLTIVNLGLDGKGAGAGLINTGSRLRVKASKIEGDDIACQLLCATVAEEGAGDAGTCGDILFEDCETAWATTGVLLTGSDFGGVTQVAFTDCRHHNHSAATFEESHGAGGSAGVHFQNLEITRGRFGAMADGTIPTKFISLNDDNGNTGFVAGSVFPTAINSGKNLCSTGLIWASNLHTGGISTGQPS